MFATAATGSSSSLLPPVPASTAAGTGSTQPGLVGSGIVPYRGSLTATVPVSGPPTLDAHGKPLATLKAGLYEIVVRETSPRGGFFVEKGHTKPLLIAGVGFTGKRTVQVRPDRGPVDVLLERRQGRVVSRHRLKKQRRSHAVTPRVTRQSGPGSLVATETSLRKSAAGPQPLAERAPTERKAIPPPSSARTARVAGREGIARERPASRPPGTAAARRSFRS